MNDKIELRAAAARLLYGNNRDSADYDMLVNYIDSSEPVQHWIPCSERLPEDGEVVIACSSDRRCLRFAEWDGQYDDFGVWNIGKKRYRTKTFPYWMPLPEPPEMCIK